MNKKLEITLKHRSEHNYKKVYSIKEAYKLADIGSMWYIVDVTLNGKDIIEDIDNKWSLEILQELEELLN